MRQTAVQPSREQIGFRRRLFAASHEYFGKVSMERLHHNFPERTHNQHQHTARHEPSKQSERVLKRHRGAFHVSSFERQFSQLALNLSAGAFAVRQVGGLFEKRRGVVIQPPQHQYVAQALADGILGGPVGRICAALGNPILLFGHLQRMPGSRLPGAEQRVGQGPLAVPGRVKVIGKIENALG